MAEVVTEQPVVAAEVPGRRRRALGVVLIAVSVLIVVFTLAQEQKGQGLSGAIMGESSATMAAGRERGVDAKLAKLTKICGVVFFVVTLVVCVLSARL